MNFEDIVRGLGLPDEAQKPKTEKGVPVRGKRIDGVQYVRLEDVCDLLKVNGILPTIEKKWRGQL